MEKNTIWLNKSLEIILIKSKKPLESRSKAFSKIQNSEYSDIFPYGNFDIQIAELTSKYLPKGL